MVINDTGSVEGIYAFIYCTKWRFGQVPRMPDGRTDGQTLKDSATQLLIKYKSGALVTQCCFRDSHFSLKSPWSEPTTRSNYSDYIMRRIENDADQGNDEQPWLGF